MTDNQTTTTHNDGLIFYEVMEYPVPKQRKYFLCADKAETEIEEELDGSSRVITQKNTKEYLQYINKWSRLFRSIPFIKTIYLCNSITFNSVHEDSDIDVFIVTKEKALRRARFWSVFLFRIL